MCLMAISRDFLEIVLPNPVLSVAVVVDDFTGFRVDNSETCEALRESCMSGICPLVRFLPGGSVTDLPLVTMGDECLLDIFTDPVASWFPFTVRAAPGRDLPADTGLSGKVVLRLGGVSRGKSGGTTGCCGGRTLGLGELGRDVGAELRPFDITRPDEVEGTTTGDVEATGFRRVGVDEREFERAAVEFKFAGICGLELGVDGLEFWDGRVLSTEEPVRDGRVLEGVEDLDTEGRADGVEGLAEDVERVLGEAGLM
ncbi:hypothetical protein JRO89_XS12G0253300 [Xanthoceras sorbifolium]|uniref:Uncharacterized protein n=1 Tax=Xanthoceras sorbifolium TaxID=99658 RepID=A0ABQ8HDS7_9ROSI|nr:hypothetical protein JRO89_XS12G0253300 [Xanthoceras sorbifolium]